jgi:putative methyltransferase (TIGR04325 family)
VEAVAKMYERRWPAFLESLNGSGPLGVAHVVPVGEPLPKEDLIAHNMIMVFAYTLTLCARDTATLSVLDWGGALGHYHAIARALVPKLELDYHCKELPAVCARGRRLSPEVAFHETEDCLEHSYDLVLASGSIQYHEQWGELLDRLAGAARRYLLITMVPLTDAERSFVVLQRAHRYGYDTEYLGWALNPQEVRDTAKRARFELVREFPLFAPVETPGAPGRISHGGFLLRRK